MTAAESANLPLDVWPLHIATILHDIGITTWRDLCALSPGILLREKGFGRTALRFVEGEMAARRLTFEPHPETVTRRFNPDLITPSPGVYFVACGEYIKIGCAGNLRRRVMGLQIAIPWPLEVLAFQKTTARKTAYTLEKSLHHRFRVHRHRGEWFRNHEVIREYIHHLPQESASE